MKLYEVNHISEYRPRKNRKKKEGHTYIQVVASNPMTARELAEKYLKEECDSIYHTFVGYQEYDTWRHYHIKE